MARLSTIKTLAAYEFSFQPSLDRQQILALAELDFVERHQALHLLGPPGTGKTHLAIALGVEAVKAGHSVHFSSLADLIASLSRAEREHTLRERVRYLSRHTMHRRGAIYCASWAKRSGRSICSWIVPTRATKPGS